MFPCVFQKRVFPLGGRSGQRAADGKEGAGVAPSQPEFQILHYPRISRFLSNEGVFVGVGVFFNFFFPWLM